MSEDTKYAVYFHANALEAIGEVINPFVTQGPNGPFILCTDLDTGGALAEMTVEGRNADGKKVETEIMVPIGMIKLVLSVGGDGGTFGFAIDE
jgi:hypothetical protein